MASVLGVTLALGAGCSSANDAMQHDGTGPGAGGTGAGAAPPAGADPRPAGAGPTAPPAVKCSREAAARPAPASLFDAFQKDVANLPEASRSARVDQLLSDVAAQGGTPLEDFATGRTVFLVRGAPPKGRWAVTTSLVDLDVAKATPLVAVAGTDLWTLQVTIPRGTSFQYRLVSGTSLVEDKAARNVVWDGVSRPLFTAGEFNAIGHAMDWPKDRGRLVRHGRVRATKLANERDVFVYLPPRYDDASCKKLPSVVFQDGNEALTLGDFAHAADDLYKARPELSAVLVFASNSGTDDTRTNEYGFGYGDERASDYVDFLVTDLWPSVKSAGYRVCSKATARGLSGASLGGLVATYAVFEKPDQWGWVGAQSAAFFWNDNALINRVSASPKVPSRFYLDTGDDAVEPVDQMATAMSSKGYDVKIIKQPGALHDWPFWAIRFGEMMTHFRAGKTDCD